MNHTVEQASTPAAGPTIADTNPAICSRMSTSSEPGKKPGLRPAWMFAGGAAVVLALALGGWLWARSHAASYRQAPEAARVLAAQAGLPFQILIPAYLPRGFDRAALQLDQRPAGPGGQPLVQLTYRSRNGTPLFIREWLPALPHQEAGTGNGEEVLNGAKPVYTKWGTGWLLCQDTGLCAIWVDIGALRASIYTPAAAVLPGEELLAIAETLGPASNRQVFDVLAHPPALLAAVPPPLEIPLNAEGVQEVDLIVSASGYSPAHFSVRRGIPVRLTFRQLGWVGCGNEITFPTGPGESVDLLLESPTDKKVIEFTPQVAGDFQFSCTHMTYKGILTVQP
jgi:hypothetical protein